MRVVVIGGGPAGMIAAITASKYGNDVTLFEKMRSVGRKLSITGKGRCNITNATNISEFMNYIPGNPKFMYSAFHEFSNEDIIQLMHSIGVDTKVERGERVFPQSDKALEVVDKLKKEMEKLQKNLGGIKDMTEIPGVLFVVDPKKERIAILEARKLNIPVVGLVDTNCNPEGIDFPIPGNDDAIRAISLFTSIIANAVIEADNDTGLRVVETLDDEDGIQTDASNKSADAEITDYENYQPTEQKEEDIEAEEDHDDLIGNEDDLYRKN